jgi:hypothetical protein
MHRLERVEYAVKLFRKLFCYPVAAPQSNRKIESDESSISKLSLPDITTDPEDRLYPEAWRREASTTWTCHNIQIQSRRRYQKVRYN